MASAQIGYVNLADSGTTVASTQLLLAPVSNLKNPHVQRKWRSTSQADYILVDLGSSVAFNAVALMGVTGNTIRFRFSSTDATGATGDVWDSGFTTVNSSYSESIDLHGGTARYVRIDIAASTTAYCEAGRLFIGATHQFVSNFGYGWTRKFVDPSLVTKTRGGQTQISNMPAYRSLQVTFNDIAASELYSDIENIDLINSLKTDVLFITNPASTNLPRDTLWGLMTSLNGVTQPYFSKFSKQYNIEERL